MNVSVVIPTRGNVDMAPITESFPANWEVLVYDNGKGICRTYSGRKWGVVASDLPDLSVYARYAAIEYASHDLVLTQDDDVIVSDPQAIVDEWWRVHGGPEWRRLQGGTRHLKEHLVANMPQEFRPHYPDSCLVGFGACFHRKLPDEAFALMMGAEDIAPPVFTEGWGEIFERTCDVVFTALTPRVLVDVPKTDLPYASDPNRMWKQPNHVAERTRMLDLVRQIP